MRPGSAGGLRQAGQVSPPAGRQTRGFTLLELLVVLAIVSLATAVVVPAAGRWLSAAQDRAWREDVRARLTELPTLAFAQGRPIELDADALRAWLPSFPKELDLHLTQTLRYSSTGVASGGVVEAYRAGERRPLARWQVEPVSGALRP